MRILSYTVSPNKSSYRSEYEYEVELLCDTSLSEIANLTKQHILDPLKTIELQLKTDIVDKEEQTKKVQARFGGMITLSDGKQVYIEKVIYDRPVTVVFWSDGVKTRSTCDKDDSWNPEFGLTLCVMKRFMSNEQLNLLYKDWSINSAESTRTVRTLHDVRKEQKSR